MIWRPKHDPPPELTLSCLPTRTYRQRRKAILAAHPEVRELIGQEASTLPLLAAVNLAQVGACVAAAHLPTYELVPAAVLVGGTLSLWQVGRRTLGLTLAPAPALARARTLALSPTRTAALASSRCCTTSPSPSLP